MLTLGLNLRDRPAPFRHHEIYIGHKNCATGLPVCSSEVIKQAYHCRLTRIPDLVNLECVDGFEVRSCANRPVGLQDHLYWRQIHSVKKFVISIVCTPILQS